MLGRMLMAVTLVWGLGCALLLVWWHRYRSHKQNVPPQLHYEPVDVATTGQVKVREVAPPVVDGEQIFPGMRILVRAQALPEEQGVYTVRGDKGWARDTQLADTGWVWVRSGEQWGHTAWLLRAVKQECTVEPAWTVLAAGSPGQAWTWSGWQPHRDPYHQATVLYNHDVYDVPTPDADGAYRFVVEDGTSSVQCPVVVEHGLPCADVSRALIRGQPLRIHMDDAVMRVKVPDPTVTYQAHWYRQ